MASVDEFFKSNPQLAAAATRSEDSVFINAVVLGGTEQALTFQFLKKTFSVLREDVLDISSESDKPSNGGIVIIKMKAGAKIDWVDFTTAQELDMSVPFAFARPSIAPPVAGQSPALTAWYERTGYSPRLRDGTVVPFSSVPCESVSNRVYDDSQSDNYD